jgi:hypothetical protein
VIGPKSGVDGVEEIGAGAEETDISGRATRRTRGRPESGGRRRGGHGVDQSRTVGDAEAECAGASAIVSA